MKLWIEELKSNGPSDILIWVIGNKTDRVADE
jgi:GTPase SAR1 family protein